MHNPDEPTLLEDVPPPDDPDDTPTEDAPPTGTPTSAVVPAGHRMPTGYNSDEHGIVLEVQRTDREGNPADPKITRVSYGPIAIVAMFQSCEGDQWFDIRWHDGFKTITRRVDGTVLRSGRALVRELGSAGIPLFEADARAAERFLAAYLMTNGGALRSNLVHVARHLGWQDDGTFVACDGGPWPVEPGQPEQRPILTAYRPSGTLAGWQEAVRRVERYPVVRVALAAAFAPVLLKTLRLRSATLDISGRSTRGKSTAAALALSAWADPSADAQGMGTWKSGIIMIEKRLNLVRGLPTVLDETRVVKSPDIVDQVLYQVSMDQGAARGGGWASMLPWSTILISTGEQPALSFTSHEGAAARVMSLRRAPFGTGGPASAADATAVTDAIGRHFGTAGPAFAAKVAERLGEPDGAERLRKMHYDLTDKHAAAAPNDVAKRRAPWVAALHMAAILAHDWGIVPLPALPLETWTELLSEESAREDRGGMALEIVRSLIGAEGHRLQPAGANVKGGPQVSPPPGGWIGAHTDVAGAPAVALLPGPLADALATATPPIVLDAVKEAWIESKTVPLDNSKRLIRKRVGTEQIRCFVFTRAVLDGEPDEDDAADDSSAQPSNSAEPDAVDQWPAGSYGEQVNA